jgi:hypothetical protein
VLGGYNRFKWLRLRMNNKRVGDDTADDQKIKYSSLENNNHTLQR